MVASELEPGYATYRCKLDVLWTLTLPEGPLDFLLFLKNIKLISLFTVRFIGVLFKTESQISSHFKLDYRKLIPS